MTDEVPHLDRASRRVALVLAGVMLLSFGFGVSMFLPAEHRAQKLDEMKAKYQQRVRRARSIEAD